MSTAATDRPGRVRAAVLVPLLCALFGLELALITRGFTGLAPTLRASLLLSCGLAIGMLPLVAGPLRLAAGSRAIPRAALAWCWVGLFLLVSVASYPALARAIRRYPLDPVLSDVYPQVSVNIRHLLEGGTVYKEHSELGRAVFPPWLPLQWLPFLVTTAIGVDHRWLPPVVLGALVLALGLVDIRRRPPGLPLALALVSTLLVPWAILVRQPQVAGWSLELLIGAYYLVLAWALRERSAVLLGVGLGSCLLSRYALAPWMLLLALAFAVAGRWRRLVLAAGVAAAMVVGLYGLPFLSRDPGILLRSHASYATSFEVEWARPASDNHLYEGYGLAGWASDHVSGDTARRLHKVQRLHLVVSLAAVALLAPLVVRAVRRFGDPHAPALYALKAFLAVFYAFVPVPYPRLWVVAAVLSSQVVAAFVLPSAERQRTGPAGSPAT